MSLTKKIKQDYLLIKTLFTKDEIFHPKFILKFILIFCLIIISTLIVEIYGIKIIH